MKQELEWDFPSQHCQAKQTVFELVQEVIIGCNRWRDFSDLNYPRSL